MPVQRTTVGGKPAYRWGSSGKAYPYTAGDAASRNAAKARAEKYGRAVKANQAQQNKRRSA